MIPSKAKQDYIFLLDGVWSVALLFSSQGCCISSKALILCLASLTSNLVMKSLASYQMWAKSWEGKTKWPSFNKKNTLLYSWMLKYECPYLDVVKQSPLRLLADAYLLPAPHVAAGYKEGWVAAEEDVGYHPQGSTGHTSCCTSDPSRCPRWRQMMISPWVLPVTCRYQTSSKTRVLNSHYWVW